ncbi:MAG: RNA-binding protein, partial [Thermoproteota archaeon]
GVKVDVGAPFPDTPDKGVLITNVELLPMASPTFEPGPPDENAIEMARVVDRALRGSNAIAFEELVIKEGEHVYLIFLDMYVLDHDGNLIDALALASVTALKNAMIPEVTIGPDGGLSPTGEYRPLPMRDLPITFSFAKIGRALLLDPCLEEELVADALITLSIDRDGRVCSIQKREGSLTAEEIINAIRVARSKWPDLARMIEEGGA